MKIVSILLLLTVPAFGVGLRDVPQLPNADYAPSLRDPFVDASVSPTILGATGARDLRSVAPPLEAYTAELEALFRKEHKVHGIAIAGEMQFAVVNGKTMKPGTSLSVALPDELSQRLQGSSQYYGLGLEPQLGAKRFQAEVAAIIKTGLVLKIRGTTLHLGYHKNLSPQ